MSNRARLFVIVEGKQTDKWFYDQVCRTSDKIRSAGYVVYPVEFATRGLGESGGKARVMKLFDLLRKAGKLGPIGRRRQSLMFCVDSDHDRLVGQVRRSAHLMYTRLPDVEAHVYDGASLLTYISRSHSATHVEARMIARELKDWREELAVAWRDWFELCLAAHYVGLDTPAPGGKPKLLNGSERDIDNAFIRRLETKVRDAVGEQAYRAARRRASNCLASRYERNRGYTLLKGKWLAGELRSRSNACVKDKGLPEIRSNESVREAIKGSMRFNRSAIGQYVDRLESLVS